MTQNIAFLDPQGHLVTLRPNALSDLPKILHASPNMLGAYLCQISAFESNDKIDFLAWKARKKVQNGKILVF